MGDTRITDAEIAGHMGWRGPGAYTEASLRKIRGIVEHVLRAERAAASETKNQELRDVFDLAWNQALSDAAFYAESHCGVDEHHLEHMLELVPPKLRVRGVEIASRPAEVDDEGLPPIDCSGTPASCPDNEGYGCHCSQVAEAVSVDRLSITKMVSESMTKHRVKYQPGMGGMIVDIMEKFGIPPSHTTNKEK